MIREEKLSELLDDINKKMRELDNARNAYDFARANATDDPEPQADDVETIREIIDTCAAIAVEYMETIDTWEGTVADSAYLRLHIIDTAMSRLSASIDVQAKAEAVVHLFEGYAILSGPQKYELSRLIVEQFSPAPKAKE
jgi:hypothetical protein